MTKITTVEQYTVEYDVDDDLDDLAILDLVIDGKIKPKEMLRWGILDCDVIIERDGKQLRRWNNRWDHDTDSSIWEIQQDD